MENIKLHDKIRIFDKVYYYRKDSDIPKKLPKFRMSKDFMILYIKKLLKDFKLDFNYFNGEIEGFTILGMGCYENYEKEKIAYCNVSFQVIKKIYQKIYDNCLKYKEDCPTIRLNYFDRTLHEDKKLLTDYIFFLRAFPYFNYFMRNLMKHSISDEDMNKIDYEDKPEYSYSFMNRLNHTDKFYYLENISNLLTGNLNLYDYFFDIENMRFESEEQKRIMACYQMILENNMTGGDIFKTSYEFFSEIYNSMEMSDDNINNMAIKWIFNKYLIIEMKTYFDEDNPLFKSFNDFCKRITEVESLTNKEFLLPTNLYDDVKNAIIFIVNLLIIVLQMKGRDDACLIYTLLFSSKYYKYICYVGDYNKNFLFNTILNFEIEKNDYINIS